MGDESGQKGATSAAIVSGAPSIVRKLEGHANWVRSVCVTADGLHVVTGSADKTACVWRFSDGACLKTLKGHTGWLNSVCVTADGLHVVTGSDDKTACVWRLSDGETLTSEEKPPATTAPSAFSSSSTPSPPANRDEAEDEKGAKQTEDAHEEGML